MGNIIKSVIIVSGDRAFMPGEEGGAGYGEEGIRRAAFSVFGLRAGVDGGVTATVWSF